MMIDVNVSACVSLDLTAVLSISMSQGAGNSKDEGQHLESNHCSIINTCDGQVK